MMHDDGVDGVERRPTTADSAAEPSARQTVTGQSIGPPSIGAGPLPSFTEFFFFYHDTPSLSTLWKRRARGWPRRVGVEGYRRGGLRPGVLGNTSAVSVATDAIHRRRQNFLLLLLLLLLFLLLLHLLLFPLLFLLLLTRRKRTRVRPLSDTRHRELPPLRPQTTLFMFTRRKLFELFFFVSHPHRRPIRWHYCRCHWIPTVSRRPSVPECGICGGGADSADRRRSTKVLRDWSVGARARGGATDVVPTNLVGKQIDKSSSDGTSLKMFASQEK